MTRDSNLQLQLEQRKQAKATKATQVASRTLKLEGNHCIKEEEEPASTTTVGREAQLDREHRHYRMKLDLHADTCALDSN